MKAVIVKTDKNKAVALKADGTFVHINKSNCMVGQEVFIKDRKRQDFGKLARVAAAAVACLLFFSFGASYAYNQPQSYVSIDINPSIELEINMFNRVIDAHGVNQDGATVLDKADIDHKSMERAIELIISQANKEGYIVQNNNKTVLVGVHCSSVEKEREIMENAKIQVDKTLSYLAISTTVSVNSVSAETIDKAKKMGTTAGKLDYVKQYSQQTGDNTQVEELLDTPIENLTSEMAKEKAKKQDKDVSADIPAEGNDSSEDEQSGNANNAPDVPNNANKKDEGGTESPDTDDEETDSDKKDDSDKDKEENSNGKDKDTPSGTKSKNTN